MSDRPTSLDASLPLVQPQIRISCCLGGSAHFVVLTSELGMGQASE